MIFKVSSDLDVRETNENIDSVPAFSGCSDKVLKYVFLMYDYDSPYSRLPEEIRKQEVLVAIGYTNDNSIRSFFSRNKEGLEASKDAFIKMQYSVEFETLIAMKAQMTKWNELLLKEDQNARELTLIQRLFGKIPDYMKKIKDLEELVGYREKYENEADEPRTALESYMEIKRGKNEGLQG